MSRRSVPLNGLRAFEAAARHLSFAKGADELHVTPAAISQQIRSLEEFLGQPLFIRGSRGIELSLAGKACLPHLQSAFDQIDFAVSSACTNLSSSCWLQRAESALLQRSLPTYSSRSWPVPPPRRSMRAKPSEDFR